MTPKHTDTSLSVETRVQSLLDEMTVPEKVAQIAGIWAADLMDKSQGTPQFSPTKAQAAIPHGIGELSRVSSAGLQLPNDSAKLANTMQRFLVENTRLHIPGIVHEESCAGYMARGAATFPQAIGLAATWAPDLIRRMSDVIRKQMRAVGAHHSLAPVLDVARDPRWGRTEETFGEDPFLITAIGTAYIDGLQGPDMKQGIMATAKHFVGYALSEGGMNWAPNHIPERELREVYLTPFKAAVQASHIASVMNAYHEHDGVPCGSSQELLQKILRDEFGFKGLLSSDYFTIKTFMEYHRIAKDKAEAARFGLLAGIDLELPSVDCYGQPLLEALESGAIDVALVEVCVRRVLTAKFELGLFENPYVDEGSVPEVYGTKEQRDLSRELACQSMVLLKNENKLLPLTPTLKSIAVIGPSADSVRLMQGDYHYPAHFESLFIPDVSADAPVAADRMQAVDWAEHFPPSTTVLAGIRAAVSPQTQVHYAQGCDTTATDTAGFAAAVEAAKKAEVAIVVVGDKSGLKKGCTSGESIDSGTLNLPGVQQALVEAVYATGTPTVVVMLTGRPYAISWIAEHVPAVVQAWLPAEAGGEAIAAVLFGQVNPGGKLPISFPRHVGQVPVFYSHKPSGGRTHWQGNYFDMLTTPLYPFGHGLSYTEFAYRDLQLSSERVNAGEHVSISVTVQNTGTRAGDEVVQLYVHDLVASVTRPVAELKGFQRLTLQPGESRQLTFDLDSRHLAFHDRDMRYVVEPGDIEVMVGSSSADIRLRQTFSITGETLPVQQAFFTPVQQK